MVTMICPDCGGEAPERSEPAELNFRGEIHQITTFHYECPKCGKVFHDENQDKRTYSQFQNWRDVTVPHLIADEDIQITSEAINDPDTYIEGTIKKASH